ncbi:hypothetical protein A8709_08630 [Paenibacillus pectinilyticus]|uniref:DNA-binding response regulator n=1 Tax=Paenibacillus pectinilyticus TaxID=512399 RepID=A0A1C1A857_9BACL|nr:helix-turn-helix domain-containing protein [Paenibacillus pectinilyticus]OCT16719.1 hypothetical protein A8709_08630 [Paenibacillus pectinilyticus]
MYNLLIVDDELPVVQGLMADLDTEKLKISHVYTAYNIRQAKEVLQSLSIDIMLCDIEMPQGSGLELLEWSNVHYPELQTIFLTSHADFRYAKKAIQLGSLEYLLKPVPDEELEDAIEKAKAKLSDTHKTNNLERLWSANHPSIIEHFWTELMQQRIASTPDAIRKAVEERNVPFSPNMLFLPIVISIRRWHKMLSVRDEKIMEYALKNSGLELISSMYLSGPIITMDRGCLLLILAFEQEPEESVINEQLIHNCQKYVDSCHQFFFCDLSCYIGNLVKVEEMVTVVSQLRDFESNNVVYDNTVFLLTGSSALPKMDVAMPDMSVWAVLLKNGKNEQVLREIRSYLDGQITRTEVNAQLLLQFHQNFVQTVYFVLLSKGMLAHELFSDSESMELSHHATKSMADLMRWVEHTVNKLQSRESAGQHSDNVIENVKKFIAAHLDQSDLSREEIAKHAFLNPDYLARLFKKEIGFSIMEYLLQERIEMAKKLLLKSDLSVADIANSVGYSHFSHFARMFKKLTGLNPNEFRQQS